MDLERAHWFFVAAVILTLLRIIRPFYKRYSQRKFESEREEHETTWRSIRAEDPEGD